MRYDRIVVCEAVSIIAVIATEQLIAAVTAQNDLHLFAGHLRDQIHTHRQRVRRLIQVANQPRKRAQQRRVDLLLVVSRAVALGHQSGGGRLIELAVRQPYREGLEVVGKAVLHQQGHDKRRVQSTAHERADRDIADQVQAQTIDQPSLQFFEQVVVTALELRLVAQVPVALDPQALLAVEHQVVRRRQLPHITKHAARRRDESQGQVLVQGRQIELCQGRIGRQQGLDLGGEEKLGAALHVIEGLLSEAIPCGEDPPSPAVPDREREHAAQVLQAAGSVFLVEPEDRLGVRPGPELETTL